MSVALIVALLAAAGGALLPAAASAQTAAGTRLAGVVRDASGAVISGAAVIVRTPSGIEQQTLTGPDGRFTVERAASGQATLVIRAGGFAEREQPIPEAGEIDVVLVPARITETITVTPTRTEQRLGDVPA
ncbi:MAG TPA: carboxypeptidase-like regulatory domain-containing protein, partial [Vicinamibacterales bacterium]|nr:carboxypeptidase-like regulatory domain-containing protein [Vicinamibacterales bacterium]